MDETKLRQYLVERGVLTDAQVDEVFTSTNPIPEAIALPGEKAIEEPAPEHWKAGIISQDEG